LHIRRTSCQVSHLLLLSIGQKGFDFIVRLCATFSLCSPCGSLSIPLFLGHVCSAATTGRNRIRRIVCCEFIGDCLDFRLLVSGQVHCRKDVDVQSRLLSNCTCGCISSRCARDTIHLEENVLDFRCLCRCYGGKDFCPHRVQFFGSHRGASAAGISTRLSCRNSRCEGGLLFRGDFHHRAEFRVLNQLLDGHTASTAASTAACRGLSGTARRRLLG
jgi:hypothetical protein